MIGDCLLLMFIVLQLPRGVQAMILDSGATAIRDSQGAIIPLINTATPATLDEEAEVDGRACDVIVQFLGYRALSGTVPTATTCRMQFFAFEPVATPALILRHAGENTYVFVPESSDSKGCIRRYSIEASRGIACFELSVVLMLNRIRPCSLSFTQTISN